MIKFYKTATCQLILNITNVENHNTQHLSNKMVQKKKNMDINASTNVFTYAF